MNNLHSQFLLRRFSFDKMKEDIDSLKEIMTANGKVGKIFFVHLPLLLQFAYLILEEKYHNLDIPLLFLLKD